MVMEVCVCLTGSCHCGQCICSPQEWWVSGEFCECDDRECDKHDGLICTGNDTQCTEAVTERTEKEDINKHLTAGLTFFQCQIQKKE